MNDERIATLEARIADLSARLASKPKRTKKSKTPVACWCGCDGLTKSRFVPGHDARFHGRAKKVARNELDGATELERLPHDEARAELTRHVELELDRLTEEAGPDEVIDEDTEVEDEVETQDDATETVDEVIATTVS